jgi:hypothetical protein
MEMIGTSIYSKIAVMKKILGIAASLILVIVSANAQSEKKEPPPPPPKPKDEVVKLTPSKIVKDEEEQVKAPPPPPKIIIEMAEDFYTRNPSVAEISRQGNIITLKMKDGTKEKYDMNKKEEDKNFTEKYGASPIPSPPPPPKKVS